MSFFWLPFCWLSFRFMSFCGMSWNLTIFLKVCSHLWNDKSLAVSTGEVSNHWHFRLRSKSHSKVWTSLRRVLTRWLVKKQKLCVLLTCGQNRKRFFVVIYNCRVFFPVSAAAGFKLPNFGQWFDCSTAMPSKLSQLLFFTAVNYTRKNICEMKRRSVTW